MREIKFRAWDKGKMNYEPVIEIEEDASGCELNLAVKDFELMQFTGLLDKNGVEIYEGDVVQTTWKCVVEWEDARFILRRDEGKYPLSTSHLAGMEVIGNIHQNPELLK